MMTRRMLVLVALLALAVPLIAPWSTSDFAISAQEGTPGNVDPDISVYEVVGRAQAAISQAGTYRYESFTVDETVRTPGNIGEVNLQQGLREQSPDGSYIGYLVEGMFYFRGTDGTWSVYTPPHYSDEPLVVFLRLPATDWTLAGTEPVEGRPAYVIERVYMFQIELKETLWIDAETFLPIKRVETSTDPNATWMNEKVYSDFGAAIDIQVPPEALQPTPTPLPPPPANPMTSDSPSAIAEGFFQVTLNIAAAGPDASASDEWFAYFAPDRRYELSNFAFSLVETCHDVSYETVERQSMQSGVPYAEVTLIFSPECPIEEGSDTDSFVVYLERSTGYWYVYDVDVVD